MKSNRRLLVTAVVSVCAIALLGFIPCANANEITTGPVVNPYLASPHYAITHFDSSQSDSTPYGPPRGFFTVDPATQPISYGGPINIITLASTEKNYMWAVGSNRVSYVFTGGNNWTEVAKFEALADATDNVLPAIPDENFRTFGESSAVGMNVTSMDSYLKSLFGDNYQDRGGHGSYSVVDNNNVLYTNYGDTLYAFALKDPGRPSDGITIRYKIDNMVATIEGNDPAPPPGTRLFGLSMTYDGHIIVTFSNGVAVIDRDLNIASKSFYRFPDSEYVSNSIAVDENNGIYVASNSIMRKLVWTGTTLSANESDGAWASPYDNSLQKPPIISFSNGTGSTPTLMGFGDDPDKLVVITDGAKQMKLVAFWRDNIPAGFVQKPGTKSRRIADQTQVTCGFTTLPEYIQSEQSVVVDGYGAFVVNNIPDTINPDIQNKNQILQVSLMGPAYPPSYGAERFQWNPSTDEWSSVWGRSDVSSTSMIPVHSQSGNMALINGYREPNGWEVLGLDWNTGNTVHQTIFGKENFGNGAYAILEYLNNDDLLFNSIVGPIRIHYGSGPKPQFLANFTVSPTNGMAPLTVKCADKSIGNPTRYNYDFGDGVNMSGPNPVHTYRFPGTYSITLTISKYNSTSNSFMTNSITKRQVIAVYKKQFIEPIAEFSASPIRGTVPLTVTFTDKSRGNPTLYNYDFGDGINYTGPNPVHTYQFPGTYNVTLTVMKNDPQTGTIVSNVSVQKGLITARPVRNTWKFVAFGDSPDNTTNSSTGISPNLSKIASEIAGEKPDLVIYTGDLISGWLLDDTSPVKDKYKEQYGNWMAAVSSIYDYKTGSGIPLYVMRGNHEDGPPGNVTPILTAYTNTVASGMPTNGPAGEEKLTYSFTYRDAKFIINDEYIPHNGLEETVNQSWVDSQLTEDTRPFTFVFGHSPAYRVDNDIEELPTSLFVHPEQRDVFWQSLVDNHVSAYLCGHAHMYVRGEFEGIPQIVTGNAGAPMEAFNLSDLDPVLDLKYPLQNINQEDQKFGYLLVTVNDATGTWSGVQKEYDPGTGTWITGDTFTLPARSPS